MFDYTYHKCPVCNKIIKNQSKAGPCSLSHFYYGNIATHLEHLVEGEELQPAPMELINEAVVHGLTCKHCGHNPQLQ